MKKRYQVFIKESVVKRLTELTRVTTTTEIVNEAMLLFEWAIDKAAEGKEIAAVDKASGEYQEIVLPSIRAARRQHDA